MTTALWQEAIKNRIDSLDASGIGSLDLSYLEIYSCYQTMPFCRDKKIREQLLRHQLAEAMADGGICMAASTQGQVIAVCAVRPLTWDSNHFGLSMAQMLLAASSSCSRELLSQLLKQMIARARGVLDVRHLSAEVDIDHYHCVNPMLALGFEIMDVKRYFHTTDMQDFREPRFLSLVRNYEESDYENVMRLAEKVDIHSRFSRDEFLSSEKTREMYGLWLSNFLTHDADNFFAFVFERHGNIEGCNVISKRYFPWLNEPVEFMDKGLYVSDRRGIGGFAPILYKSIAKALAQDGVVQTCTSLNNSASIRVLEQWNTHPHVSAYALRLFLE